MEMKKSQLRRPYKILLLFLSFRVALTNSFLKKKKKTKIGKLSLVTSVLLLPRAAGLPSPPHPVLISSNQLKRYNLLSSDGRVLRGKITSFAVSPPRLTASTPC